MFTIEMDWDETDIVILDDTGEYEDLRVIMYDDVVYIRQWDAELERHNYLIISPTMMLSFMKSWQLPSGAYRLNGNGDIR